jgi:hypothetical protein
MISHLLEAFAGVFLIATASLLAGLLRSAKTSSQVTEEQQSHDEQHKQPAYLISSSQQDLHNYYCAQ